MFLITKESEVSYSIKTAEGAPLVTIIGLHGNTEVEIKISALLILDYLNDPIKKAPLGFSCAAHQQPPIFPTDDELSEEAIICILGFGRRPVAYASDYQQGVALCAQLNRALR